MKEITLKFRHDEIENVISDKNKNLIVRFKNGDEFTFQRGSEKTKKLKRHLLKQFSGDHID